MTRPPNDRGQGRKPINASGELMQPRQIRMTDAEWADARSIGMSAIRAFVTRRAAVLRRASAKA